MSFVKDALGFELFHGKDILKRIAKDPKRLLLGVDPWSTKVWNKVLGKHDKPIVDQLGGAYDGHTLSWQGDGGVYKRARAAGINTGPATTLQRGAHVIAAAFGAGGIAGAGGGGAGGAAGGATGGSVTDAAGNALAGALGPSAAGGSLGGAGSGVATVGGAGGAVGGAIGGSAAGGTTAGASGGISSGTVGGAGSSLPNFLKNMKSNGSQQQPQQIPAALQTDTEAEIADPGFQRPASLVRQLGVAGVEEYS